MSNLFGQFCCDEDLFGGSPAPDSSYWRRQEDSQDPLIRLCDDSPHHHHYSQDEKADIGTDISLRDDCALDYTLAPADGFSHRSHHAPAPALPASLSPVAPGERVKRLIDISVQSMYRRAKVERGERLETRNICKRLHSETANHLKNGVKIHLFAGKEVELIRDFCNAKPSIETFRILLKNAQLSAFIRKFYQSTYFVKKVLRSKMEMEGKMVMAKYLERIREITYNSTFTTWKKTSDLFAKS